MTSPVGFLTNLRQDRWQRSEMFSWNKIINALKRSRGNINPFTTFKPSGWKCYKSAERSSRYEAPRKLGSLELLRIFRALQTSRVLHISMNTRWKNDILSPILGVWEFLKWSKPQNTSEPPCKIKMKTGFHDLVWYFSLAFFRRPTIEGPLLSTCRVWRS